MGIIVGEKVGGNPLLFPGTFLSSGFISVICPWQRTVEEFEEKKIQRVAILVCSRLESHEIFRVEGFQIQSPLDQTAGGKEISESFRE